MADFYIGAQGGIAHIKRKLDLDKTLNDKEIRTETDLEDSKIHGLVGGHIGYVYSFGKPFVGLEGYAGTHFGGDLFKPQFSFGAKGIVGMNIASNFQLYAGAGIDFIRFKSLKLNFKTPDDPKKKNYDLRKLSDFSELDYHFSPALLINVGTKYFITKNVSIGADVNLLFRKAHAFPEKTNIFPTKKGLINNPCNKTAKQDSSEKYRSIQALFNISYHFGGNA